MNLAKVININRIELIKTIGQEFPNGKGVEVGSFKGEFAKQIMKVWSGKLYMIDVWRGIDESIYLDSTNNSKHNDIYKDVMNNISGYEERAIMIRASSESMVDVFEDSSLDFVYIDANHAYQHVTNDINLWYPKVKSGGFLCGHDYLNIDWSNDPNFAENGKDKHIWSGSNYMGVFGVNPAVDEFCKEMGYELQVSNEWYGSWFFRKN